MNGAESYDNAVNRWMPIADAINLLGKLAVSDSRLTRQEKDAVTMACNSLERSHAMRVKQFWAVSGEVMLCCPRCRKALKVGYNVRKDVMIAPSFCERCGQKLRYAEEDLASLKKASLKQQ